MAPKKENLVTGTKQEKKKRELPEAAKPHMFQPGVSGNPSGRAKDPFRQALLKAVSKALANDPEGRAMIDGIALQLATKALKGDLTAIGMIADRTDGKPSQAIQHTGFGEGPIQFMNMTPEEKQLRVAALLARQVPTGDKDGKPKQR